MLNVHNIVSKYVCLPPTPTGTGWYQILCPVCNDHGNKGNRAAFRFDTDYDCSYNCFNCGHTATFQGRQTANLSHDLITLFNSFLIPEREWEVLHLQVLENQGLTLPKHQSVPQTQSIEPNVITLPSHFYPLKDVDPELDQWAYIARDYLEHDRCVDPDLYPYYLSTGVTEVPHEKHTAAKWLGRIIIPIYNQRNELIYYQGRALIDLTKKYESPSEGKTKVLYGFDEVYKRSNLPLYILEGFFDAYSIGGCATLGNTIRDEQLEHLRRSQRQKVLIPDKFGDGDVQARQALKEGWAISTPAIGDCKDVNQAITRFGKMYVMKTIAEETATGIIAEANLALYCNDPKSRSSNIQGKKTYR